MIEISTTKKFNTQKCITCGNLVILVSLQLSSVWCERPGGTALRYTVCLSFTGQTVRRGAAAGQTWTGHTSQSATVLLAWLQPVPSLLSTGYSNAACVARMNVKYVSMRAAGG